MDFLLLICKPPFPSFLYIFCPRELILSSNTCLILSCDPCFPCSRNRLFHIIKTYSFDSLITVISQKIVSESLTLFCFALMASLHSLLLIIFCSLDPPFPLLLQLDFIFIFSHDKIPLDPVWKARGTSYGTSPRPSIC